MGGAGASEVLAALGWIMFFLIPPIGALYQERNHSSEGHRVQRKPEFCIKLLSKLTVKP